MLKSYIYIITSIIFIVSGILIGWSLTFSDKFNHIDSKTHQKKITWWKVCIVAICAALVLSVFTLICYSVYNNNNITSTKGSENPWLNEWNPYENSSPYDTYNYHAEYISNVKYPGIPLMDSRGIL
jgi:hypothetical protein